MDPQIDQSDKNDGMSGTLALPPPPPFSESQTSDYSVLTNQSVFHA